MLGRGWDGSFVKYNETMRTRLTRMTYLGVYVLEQGRRLRQSPSLLRRCLPLIFLAWTSAAHLWCPHRACACQQTKR